MFQIPFWQLMIWGWVSLFGGKSGKKVGCHKKMEGDLTELCVVVSSSPLLPSHQPRSLTQQPPEHPPNLDNHFPRKPPSEALITALPLTLSQISFWPMSCAAVNYRHFVVTFVLRGNWVRAKRRSGGVSKSGTSVSAIALCPLNDWTDYLKSIFAAMKYKREWCNSVKEWETLWCNKCAGCSIIPLWIIVCDGNFFTQVTIDQCITH